MGKYDVKTRFVFSGVLTLSNIGCTRQTERARLPSFARHFTIKAGSVADAERLIKESCGLVMGGNIHTTLPDNVIDWDFGTHPDKVVDEIIHVSDDNEDEQE